MLKEAAKYILTTRSVVLNDTLDQIDEYIEDGGVPGLITKNGVRLYSHSNRGLKTYGVPSGHGSLVWDFLNRYQFPHHECDRVPQGVTSFLPRFKGHPLPLDKSDVVLQVGAYIGFGTLKIAEKVKRVFAIEGNRMAYRILCKNMKSNDVANVIAIHDVIDNGGLTKWKEGKNQESKVNGEGGLLESASLNVYLKAYEPNVIILTTNGNELEILKDVREYLERERPKIFLATMYFDQIEAVEFLLDVGYNNILRNEGSIVALWGSQ